MKWKRRCELRQSDPTRSRKTISQTDTYHGRFVKLVPDELVVEVDEFETSDPALLGVAPADNEQGWRLALAKLAKLVEGC